MDSVGPPWQGVPGPFPFASSRNPGAQTWPSWRSSGRQAATRTTRVLLGWAQAPSPAPGVPSQPAAVWGALLTPAQGQGSAGLKDGD